MTEQWWIGWQIPGKPFEWLGFSLTGNWASRWAEATAKTMIDPSIRIWLWSNGAFVEYYEGGSGKRVLLRPIEAKW
jgi:hypothetical protein